MTARARLALREGTAEHHRRVDQLFGRFDLVDRRGYAGFLSALAGAFLPIEEAIDAGGIDRLVIDWPSRRRGPLLRADLEALGLTPAAPLPTPALDADAQLLGALYVLEGSRLGGTILKRNLGEALPQRFLGAKPPPGSWPKLLEILEENLYGPVRIGLAVDAARAAFACFEAAARRQMGTLPE